MDCVTDRKRSELVMVLSLMVMGKLRFGKSLLSSPSREKINELGSLTGFSFVNIVSGNPFALLRTICLWLEKLFPHPS